MSSSHVSLRMILLSFVCLLYLRRYVILPRDKHMVTTLLLPLCHLAVKCVSEYTILPYRAFTVCPFSNFTINCAFGSTSITSPCTSINSSLANYSLPLLILVNISYPSLGYSKLYVQK